MFNDYIHDKYTYLEVLKENPMSEILALKGHTDYSYVFKF